MKKWIIAKNKSNTSPDSPEKEYLEFQSGSAVGFDTKEAAVQFCKTVLGMSDAEIDDLYFEEAELQEDTLFQLSEKDDHCTCQVNDEDDQPPNCNCNN